MVNLSNLYFILWLQSALRAEVFPEDTQRIEGFKGQVVSAARFAPSMHLPLMLARFTAKHFITSKCTWRRKVQ